MVSIFGHQRHEEKPTFVFLGETGGTVEAFKPKQARVEFESEFFSEEKKQEFLQQTPSETASAIEA